MTTPPPTGRQPYPWVVPDLFRWFGLLGLAAVLLAVAWWGVSGTPRAGRQVGWLNLGVAAVVVSGLANTTWLLQGRRAVAGRRRALLAGVPHRDGASRGAVEPDPRRLAVPGTAHHHRAGCPAVAGKPVESMSAAEHERVGRRPCGLCAG